MANSSAIVTTIKYFLRFMPDKEYIKLYYYYRFRKHINLRKPVTFSEKLNWLKLYDRNPKYKYMVDKYEAKFYVEKLIGGQYIIPTLGVWDSFDEINFDELPQSFVLKCTHDSNGVVIVKDKSRLNIPLARKKIKSCMSRNFYYIGREWPYKDIKPRIIAEKYMEDSADGELRDYKFFCFDGKPKLLLLASGRATNNLRFDYYDMNYNHLNIVQDHPNSEIYIHPPKNFELMKTIARKLSEDMVHARIDFYEVDGNVYFGEITLYHHSGFAKYEPSEWDKTIGDWIDLKSFCSIRRGVKDGKS